MERNEILHWLGEDEPERLEQLWGRADEVRQKMVGGAVHLRGLIEISNHCVRQCKYCGLRAGRKTLSRYRMSAEEIFNCARQAVEFGYGTVVIQAGEDYGITADWLVEIIQRIKSESNLAVTLSMGERSVEDIEHWRRAGADRYLLRFETSDGKLYQKIHPAGAGQSSGRLALLKELKELGYEVGSGVMIGIPGQNYESLAEDIQIFRELDLDMIGVGPYIAHPDTPLGVEQSSAVRWTPEQVANTELMVYKVVALARLVCPEANIPSTTALATINIAAGRELGLSRGANVIMPNLTPLQYRKLYEIYPAKACINESADQCKQCLRQRIEKMGRYVGVGVGGRQRGCAAVV